MSVDRSHCVCHKRGWTKSMKQVFPIFFAVCLALPGQTPTQHYRRAVVRTGPEPGIRFSTGLSVCDEALRDGHWVSRYWLSSGMVKPENHLEQESRQFRGLPLDAFQ